MTLTIDGVSKQFNQTGKTPAIVLKDIDLTIPNGQFVSLLGPSGCGKSTLLSILAGLQKPTSGKIFLDDVRITTPSPDKGVVFQEAALFPWLNVLENVMFPLRKKMPKKQQTERAKHFLQMVQLGKFLEHYPHELSGGMQQRVSIARVLAMDPTLLLMDEPFGALDEQTRIILQQEVEKIWLDTKKTVLFVTHSIREAITLSDRILVMGARPGTIIKDFSVDLARPRKKADMAPLEETIMDLLKTEIAKVMREELSHASND
ncbi:ABC transporter ATP-binding protein [Ornithinibacillus gellani]|uniref:ABC transporter ATP-binding protein n=1 Tax=Ornithinibacillus gellani TaxID=2293253 RepID=UPI000F4791EA|nr:ABC transporter ATP-binding protein [Ornithinibacillus gellani]TQS75622.1 ABC transporter ATP-binding protein [Ornithinibacillus gellani]